MQKGSLMRRECVLLPLGAVMLWLVGCGGGAAKGDALITEMLGTMDEMSATLEKAASAKEVKPKLEALVTKFKDIEKRSKEIKVTKADDDALKAKFAPQLQKATERFMGATLAIAAKDPAGMKDLQAVLEKVK